VKVIAGLTLASIWAKQGEIYGAAGAVLGISISEVVACLYMMVIYKKKIGLFRRREKSVHYKELTRNIGRSLIYLAAPIIIGACAMPIVQNTDSAIITHTLNGMKSVFLIGKEVILNEETINSLFSLVTTYPNSIINLPAVFSMALAMSLVPSIAASKMENNLRSIAMKSGIGLKLSMLVGLPSAAGLYLLSTPITHLLYPGLQGDYLLIGGQLLGILAISVFFLTILQTMTGILQGLGKTFLPVINLFIGIGVKIAVSIATISIPEINVQGAAYGTLACYAIAALLDVICVIRCAHMRVKILDNFLKPLLATGGMSVVVYFLMPHVESGLYSRSMTLIAIAAAVLIYTFLIFFLGALRPEDMKFIPGGSKITSLMYRLKIWRSNYRYKD
jgi:stage V sporulation protein B